MARLSILELNQFLSIRIVGICKDNGCCSAMRDGTKQNLFEALQILKSNEHGRRIRYVHAPGPRFHTTLISYHHKKVVTCRLINFSQAKLVQKVFESANWRFLKAGRHSAMKKRGIPGF
jgi:hypothetical protein